TAEQILALFDGIGQGDSPRGRLRIGAVNTAQTGLLPEVLKRLAEQAPHIEPQVVPGVSLHLLDQVDAAELDLAILIRPPFNLPRGLSAQRVERQPFVLIAPPQCTATDALELLRTQPFIRYDHVSFGGRLVGDFLEAQQLRPRQVMELDEIDAIARMVENGLGVALLPRAGLWLREPARVRVIELGALEFQRELVMVSRSGSAQDDLVGEFRRALLAETAAQEA
ncbi:LysR family transcriptional regulator, partial [Pseudomonas aeruginosa]|nr:LysR family transcriptional regulator [Pseudomonas aeruginosa]